MATRLLRLNYGDATGPGTVGEILFWPMSPTDNVSGFWQADSPARIALKYNDPDHASTDSAYAPEYMVLGAGKYASAPVTVGATYGVDIIRINATKDLGPAFSITIPSGATTLDISTLTPSTIPAPTPDQILDAAVADRVTDGSLTGAAIAAKIGMLKAWAKNPDQLVAGAVTYSSGLLASAIVEWPDGKPGVLTIDSRQSGTSAVTGYHVTHVDGSTTLTYTQSTITRDSSGAATLVPQITVA